MSSTVDTRRQDSQTQNAVAQQKAIIHHILEPKTRSWQYIVADPSTSNAVIIDPVLDYDAATAKINTTTADSLPATVSEHGYKIEMILETHAHADHLTAAKFLQHKLTQSQGQAPPVGIGRRIVDVQKFWAMRYSIPDNEWKDAFDKLIDDDETFRIGSLLGVAIHLPGHTPDHMGYMIGSKFLSAVDVLLNQALQINIRAGRLPLPSAPGMHMIHVPLKLNDVAW